MLALLPLAERMERLSREMLGHERREGLLEDLRGAPHRFARRAPLVAVRLQVQSAEQVGEVDERAVEQHVAPVTTERHARSGVARLTRGAAEEAVVHRGERL